MGDLTLAQLVPVIFGSGVMGFIGLILSGRSGRQRDFDSRVDARLKELEQENQRLDARIETVEQMNAAQAVEVTRLRVLLWSHAIDPDSKPKGTT